jgi:hypothetical protein
MTTLARLIPPSRAETRNRHWFTLAALGTLFLGAAQQVVDGSFKYPVHDKTRPQPGVVVPGKVCESTAPSDAVVLFDGNSLDGWTKAGANTSAEWSVSDGVAIVAPGKGDIATRQAFGDCQFHIEWMVPKSLKCDGQHGCNSGIFFLGRYEVQILNSNGNTTYPDGMAGSLYGQYPPLVNACRPQGEWNSYDIIFRGPRFDAAAGLVRAASVTVLFNGVLVQDDVEMLGATAHAARAKYSAHEETGSIRLQDHGDPISFRNIWVRPLGAPQVAE